MIVAGQRLTGLWPVFVSRSLRRPRPKLRLFGTLSGALSRREERASLDDNRTEPMARRFRRLEGMPWWGRALDLLAAYVDGTVPAPDVLACGPAVRPAARAVTPSLRASTPPTDSRREFADMALRGRLGVSLLPYQRTRRSACGRDALARRTGEKDVGPRGRLAYRNVRVRAGGRAASSCPPRESRRSPRGRAWSPRSRSSARSSA